MDVIKKMGAMVLFLVVSFALMGQDITGIWDGELITGGAKYRMVFNIEKSGAGYSASMDIPDQYLSGIPVSVITLDGANLSLEVKNLGIVYKGEVVNETLTNGTFFQSGMQFPLSLTKGKQEAISDQKPGTMTLVEEGITGIWSGELNALGTKLLLVFNIEKRGADYAATMDIPSQYLKGAPASAITIDDTNLSLEFKNIGILYRGEVISDTLINGTFSQSGMQFSVTLTKGNH